MINRL